MAVNLSPVGGAGAQFFNNDGTVLSGGKLNTYTAGTTTPVATYTTSAGSIAHSNPIILNSAGRVSGSGEIWLTQNVSYKFVLTDSNDVLLGTYDNISGISDITLPISSNSVTYTPAGAGAVTTTVQAKLRESVSVLDYGVNTTPGTTDMYSAFLAAYNSGASRIYVPQGNYKLSQTLKLDRAVTIYGETSAGTRNFLPANTSLITFTGSGAAFEMVGSDVNGTRNMHIRDLSILGTATGSCGILVGNTPSPQAYVTMSSVINVQIKGFTAVNACGLHVQYCLNSYFRNVSCFNNYDGVKTKGINSTLTFESCWSTGNSHYGWLIDGQLSTGVFITCIAESSGIQGLYITGAVSTLSFYSWHSESNCVTSGEAPNVITTNGVIAPLYITFYGGLFGDAVGAGFRTFDLYGVAFVEWNNGAFQSYNTGFIRVDASTASCNLTTWQSNVIPTAISGNTSNQVTINHLFSTPAGSTGSIANATPVTMFTPTRIGMYTVVARLVAGVGLPAQYMATARVLFDGTSSAILADNGTALTITLSGNAVQVTQSSGGPQSTGVNFSTIYQYLG